MRCPKLSEVYWGWVVCLSFLVLFTISAGIAFSFGELIVPIGKEIHQSYSMLGWAGTLPASLPMLAAPLATVLHDRFSDRIIVIVGILLTTLSLSLASVATNVALMLVVHGAVSGFGLLCIVNPPFFLLDEYFPYSHPRHVLATSIIACGFPLATLIFNPVTYELLAAFGWRLTYVALAFMLLVLGLPLAATFRPPLQDELDSQIPRKTIPDLRDPFTIDDSGSELENHPTADGSYQNVPAAAAAAEVEVDETDLESAVIPMKTKVVMSVLWFTVSILKSIGYYTPLVTLVKQMDVIGIPQSKASQAMGLIGSCELVSRIVASYLGDRFKGKMLRIYVICTLILCVQNVIGSFAYEFSHVLVFAAALGIFGGPVIAAMYSSCSEVLGGQHVPVLFTMFRSGLGLGALFGPTIAGAIFDATGSFLIVFYFNAVTYGLTSLLYAVIIAINHYKPTCLFPPPLHAGGGPQTNYGVTDAASAAGDYVIGASQQGDRVIYEKLDGESHSDGFGDVSSDSVGRVTMNGFSSGYHFDEE